MDTRKRIPRKASLPCAGCCALPSTYKFGRQARERQIIMMPSIFIAASASIPLALGIAHLVFTFFGPKLKPRDPALEARMKEVSPVITRQTTMWKVWIGFNASHSFSAILFGSVYGYLALVRPDVLFQSAFFAILGGLFLLVYLVLAKRYWFSTPFRCLVVASILYAAGFLATLA